MNTPVIYTEEQSEQITDFIRNTFAFDGYYNIAHELNSEYVHMDVALIMPEGESKTFVTFGSGAAEMNSPFEEFTRTEFIMYASEKFGCDNTSPISKEVSVVASELQRLGRFSFAKKTWIGPGHTINASSQFRETFGYDYFIFAEHEEELDIENLGKIHFLIAIPIYKKEAEWMMEHEGREFEFLQAYQEYCYENDLDLFNINVPRDIIIPDQGEGDEDECF